MDMQQIVAQRIAEFVNIKTTNPGERMDASETAVIARALEHVKARTYDKKYKPLKARLFIPVETDADPAAEDIHYLQWDQFGTAKIVENWAKDFPYVDVLAREFSTPVKSLGNAYGYSIQDLRRVALSARNGHAVRLNDQKAMAARRAMEQELDDIACFGRADVGLPGFINNPNVTVTALPFGQWQSASRPALEVITDLRALVEVTVDQGCDVFIPDTIILPSRAYHYASQLPMSVDNTKSALSTFLDESPYIQNIDFWHKLGSVPGATGNSRAVCYFRDPEVLTLEIPQDFESFPPQQEKLKFTVCNHMRIGGTVIRYPLAIVYADDIV